MSRGRTLLDKVWSEHVIASSPQGEDLLYVDFNLINEGQSFLAFDQLRKGADQHFTSAAKLCSFNTCATSKAFIVVNKFVNG